MKLEKWGLLLASDTFDYVNLNLLMFKIYAEIFAILNINKGFCLTTILKIITEICLF